METITTNLSDKAIQGNDLSTEIKQMLSFAYHKGIKLPDNLSQTAFFESTDGQQPVNLISDYNLISTAILPSTPEAIKFIGKEFIGDKAELNTWQIPIVKKYVILTLLALMVLIGVSIMPDVNAENQDKSILALSGSTLLLNLLFICMAALLGVMFFILKTIKDKIDTFTLTPVDVFSFNISVIIGIVSGFIVSELFSFTSSIMGSSIEVHKMTLALLGGFSSDAIFSILHNIVNKIKSLFSA